MLDGGSFGMGRIGAADGADRMAREVEQDEETRRKGESI